METHSTDRASLFVTGDQDSSVDPNRKYHTTHGSESAGEFGVTVVIYCYSHWTWWLWMMFESVFQEIVHQLPQYISTSQGSLLNHIVSPTLKDSDWVGLGRSPNSLVILILMDRGCTFRATAQEKHFPLARSGGSQGESQLNMALQTEWLIA